MATTALIAPVWSMIMLGGIAGAPISIPPLPEDPALARIAPAECLWYMSASGMATPDPNSPNQTEQLFAEPEIQQLVAGIEEQIIRVARREASGREERVLATELPGLIKIALTHPLAFYVGDVQPVAGGGPPRIQAGLAVKLGEEADGVAASIQRLLALAHGGPATARPGPAAAGEWNSLPLPPDAPPVQWGIKDGYLVLGVGSGEAGRIADRLAAQSGPPAWLTAAKRALPVERRSTTGYLNVVGILERVQPLLGPDQARMPEYLGLDQVQALYTTCGMDDVACVTKGLIALDGPPRGIFAILPQDPLSPDDLATVPHDATAAVALRLDVQETLDRIIDLVATFEPSARQDFEEGLWQAETELGIDIRNDVLGSLDDTFVVYMPGGELLTAWTGSSAVVKIKDRRRLERAIDKLTVVARMETERQSPSRGPRFRESEFGDYTLHYVQFVGEPMPFTPAWCVTEGHLVAGLTPQAVKAAVARTSERGESLADVEAVADALGGAAGPASLTYVDAQKVVRGLYPMMMMGLQAVSGELAREGFELDLALLPSVEAIAPHLVPSVSTWRLAPDGFRFEAHQSLPGGDVLSSAPISVALILPAVTRARSAARNAQEMNNLRQIALAFHNYNDANGQFPTNVYDANGKALLSWRVRLLPYLEAPGLYEQFHLDEPWDSPHNRPLVAQMPAVFASPSSALPPGRTRLLALVHEDSLFPGDKKLGFRDVVDGTSNTIMFVQAGPQAAVEWTKPEDISFDPNNPKAGLMQPNGLLLSAFCDGSVQQIPLGIQGETLKRLVFRNDGQPINRQEIGR